MRSALAHAAHKRAERRQRAGSLSAVPPAETSNDYSVALAALAASILYRSPHPSAAGRPVYILNAAAFPDAWEVDYDALLSYVLARLPGEDELLSGTEYEIVFFAGGQPDSATAEKKQGPGIGWYLQAYHVLSRATRKRLQKMYIVHPRTWVRVLIGVFGTIVSPKFRRKIVHLNTLSALALQIPLEKLLIPPAVYLHDRKLSPDIYVPFVTGKRAFGVRHPLPKNINTGQTRLPRVLRETTSFILASTNIRREGLFRIPGNATLTSVLKEAYDRGQDFVIWKEQGTLVVQPGIDQSLLDEVRPEDAYGVHLAASLIKQWYRDLREPIFPESTYTSLRERYLNPDTRVTPEDLVEIILLQSEISPLTTTAREILTRHLLPLLFEIATHEADNKMNAENLSILFSMCLVCGSNQMEDAKIATIVKRVLQAALELWPQLRDGMGISSNAIYADLQSPADAQDYEDPLEEARDSRWREEQADDENESEGHRIVLEDSETSPIKQTMSKVALRVLDRSIPGRPPALPPRSTAVPVPLPTASSAGPGSDSASAFPKRKPAPPVVDPPRYSAMFDSDGASIDNANSPASYAPVDGFGPPRHGPWSFDESDKKGFGVSETRHVSNPGVMVPKRKALSSDENKQDSGATPDVDAAGARRASEGTLLARMAAERATLRMNQRNSAELLINGTSTSAETPEAVLAEGDGVFRKPLWPASARQQTLARPFQAPQQAQTFPGATNGSHLSASNVPRPRAPSPGLLKRMSSMEVVNDTSSATSSKSTLEEPKRLDLKRPSVEDLKRLYEERLSTALGLARVDAARRASMPN